MENRITILDTLSLANWHDVVVVFGNAGHARYWWDALHDTIVEKHGSDYVVRTVRALVSRRTRHSIQGWLPLESELPERYMRGAIYVTPAVELPAWVERQVELEQRAAEHRANRGGDSLPITVTG